MGTKVILVGVDFGLPNFDAQLEELGLLAKTAGFEVAGCLVCKRQAPDAAFFVGSGKVNEIDLLLKQTAAVEVLFDQSLSAAQQRNLERHLQVAVNDRTLLILQIFAQRARSREGKLQVELARLQFLSTRLVRRWTHLERQSGGIGMRGGPGETQIELDRRMIGNAIKRTKEHLQKVIQQRNTQRKRRLKSEMFAVSLVGYTNAGKSSLFNALVKARAYAADQLFATLDTTTRQMYLNEINQSISISDTVGFIKDLPHGLILAFQATLQEAVDADLLMHVIDVSNPMHMEQMQQVQLVLKEIGADDIEQILIFNKVDLLEKSQYPSHVMENIEFAGKIRTRIFVSAQTGSGLDVLRQFLAQKVKDGRRGVESRTLLVNC